MSHLHKSKNIYTLMNKDIEVLKLVCDIELQGATEIIEKFFLNLPQ